MNAARKLRLKPIVLRQLNMFQNDRDASNMTITTRCTHSGSYVDTAGVQCVTPFRAFPCDKNAVKTTMYLLCKHANL